MKKILSLFVGRGILSLLMGRSLVVFLTLVLYSGPVFAECTEGTPLQKQLCEVCGNIKAIVPIIALLMFLTAGLIYAAGQVMGAETRARANVWSTAMLVGGIIGLILAASAPYLLQVFAGAAIGSATDTTTSLVTSAQCG